MAACFIQFFIRYFIFICDNIIHLHLHSRLLFVVYVFASKREYKKKLMYIKFINGKYLYI